MAHHCQVEMHRNKQQSVFKWLLSSFSLKYMFSLLGTLFRQPHFIWNNSPKQQFTITEVHGKEMQWHQKLYFSPCQKTLLHFSCARYSFPPPAIRGEIITVSVLIVYQTMQTIRLSFLLLFSFAMLLWFLKQLCKALLLILWITLVTHRFVTHI